jgi:hypothetical protein
LSKKYEQYSEQEKSIVFATCAELEGILAGISNKHELKVIPSFLWEDMTDTIALLKWHCSELEEENETLKHNLSVYERVHAETIKHFSPDSPGLLLAGDQEIVIPGVNGPRPEHMHLDRDTATGILRGKQESDRKKHKHKR